MVSAMAPCDANAFYSTNNGILRSIVRWLLVSRYGTAYRHSLSLRGLQYIDDWEAISHFGCTRCSIDPRLVKRVESYFCISMLTPNFTPSSHKQDGHYMTRTWFEIRAIINDRPRVNDSSMLSIVLNFPLLKTTPFIRVENMRQPERPIFSSMSFVVPPASSNTLRLTGSMEMTSFLQSDMDSESDV